MDNVPLESLNFQTKKCFDAVIRLEFVDIFNIANLKAAAFSVMVEDLINDKLRYKNNCVLNCP